MKKIREIENYLRCNEIPSLPSRTTHRCEEMTKLTPTVIPDKQ